jgi:antitoxin component of MazEF toxin-antitoxin module
MIVGKIKKWGNSFGLLIPKNELKEMNIGENQEVIVEITKKENPLKELFGFGKKNRITKEEFLETRKMLEMR